MPHYRISLGSDFLCMKKQFLLLAALAAVLSACNWNSVNDHSPLVTVDYFRRNPIVEGDSIVFQGDTLRLRSDYATGETYVDTIAVGDSVRFIAELFSYYNELTGFEVQYDSTEFEVWIPIDSETREHLLPGSCPERGVLLFDPVFCYVGLEVWYRPLKVGKEPLTLVVTSNSSYSEYGIIFRQRVR